MSFIQRLRSVYEWRRVSFVSNEGALWLLFPWLPEWAHSPKWKRTYDEASDVLP